MKKVIYFLFLIVVFACQQKYDVVRKTAYDKQLNPPGTVWIKDSIYMDRCEIRNLDYLEYLSWLLHKKPQDYNAALPDTTVWRSKNFYNEPYVQYYLRHLAYRDYPVVGVSYEQAIDFCKWRTERVKEFLSLIPQKKNQKNIQYLSNIEYRLPTKEEWEYAASCGEIDSKIKKYNDLIAPEYGYDRLIAPNNLPKIWVKETNVLFGGIYSNDVTIPTFTQYPNKFALHNMIGNVAEMILEKGISKGGSFAHCLYECEISDSLAYNKPEPWLGFRCVCVVKH